MRVQLRNLGLFLCMAAPMWALAQGKAEEKKAAAQDKKEAGQEKKDAAQDKKQAEGGKPGDMQAMQMPKPAADLDQLKGLEGNWNCKGKYHASPMGPEKLNIQSSMKVKKDLDGFWYVVRVEEKGSKEHKTPWKAEELWGHQGGKFTRMLFDNFGGSGQLTSQGWQGDSMVWTGDTQGAGGPMPTRQTFTRKGNKEVSYLVEFGGPGGAFAPAIEQTCRK